MSDIITQVQKIDLLGAVHLIKATGDHVVDLNEVKEPLEWEEGVLHSFCKGCGILKEVSKVRVMNIKKELKISPPENLDGYYIETQGCSSCDGDHSKVVYLQIS